MEEQNTNMEYEEVNGQNDQATQTQKITQNDTELDLKTNIHNIEQNFGEKEQKMKDIAINSFKMRLNVLTMQTDVVNKFLAKKLIEKDNNTSTKIRDIEASISTIHTTNNFKETENELLIAENLSTELMRKINTIVKNKSAKIEVKTPKIDIKVHDYRSIITVRGTEEDVINCILKAKKALNNGKYDKAESLLLKAERMLPTKNARNLLIQVQAAKGLNQNSGSVQKPIEAVEQVNTVNEEESAIISQQFHAATKIKPNTELIETAIEAEERFNTVKEDKEESKPDDNNKNITTSQTAFKEECGESTRNLKMEGGQMLNKDKRFDPSLDVKNLSLNEDAVNNKASTSQPSSDDAVTTDTEKINDDFAPDKVRKIFYLALDAITNLKFEIARNFLKELQNQAIENVTLKVIINNLLQSVQIEIDSQSDRFSQSKSDIELEANKLLKEAENFICNNDLENAESFLVISWDMYRSPRTLLVYKKFLKARLNLFKREKENIDDGRLDENSEIIFESDRTIKLALEKYDSKHFKEAEKLLRQAAEVSSNDRINKHLLEIIEIKNEREGIAKYCNFL